MVISLAIHIVSPPGGNCFVLLTVGDITVHIIPSSSHISPETTDAGYFLIIRSLHLSDVRPQFVS